jgi:hypothetical protein
MTCFTYQKWISTHSQSSFQAYYFIFRADQLDTNVEKMIKDFKVANVTPSTASRLLHQLDDWGCDPRAISNVVAKAKKMWLSERGISTKADSGAQVLVDCLMVSLDYVFVCAS